MKTPIVRIEVSLEGAVTEDPNNIASGSRRSDIWVPIAVDAERLISDVPMVRCTYFVIASEVPIRQWSIDLPPAAPVEAVEALGLLGVVHAPRPDSAGVSEMRPYGIFSDPSEVAALFQVERHQPGLSVELEDIWVLSEWLQGAQKLEFSGNVASLRTRKPRRNDVYRVALDLFQVLYRYANDDTSLSELLHTAWQGQVLFSPTDTSAFAEWAQNEIDETIRRFPSMELKLGWHSEGESDG